MEVKGNTANMSNTGELNFTFKIIEKMEQLYLNSDFSDVIFVIDNVEMWAHKLILHLRSSYFQGMIDGGFSESSNSKIELKVPLEAFQHVLRYIYTGRVDLSTMAKETVIDFLSLCHEYSIEELQPGIASYLIENLSLENFYELFDCAFIRSEGTGRGWTQIQSKY